MGQQWSGFVKCFNSEGHVERRQSSGKDLEDALRQACRRWPQFVRAESLNGRVHWGKPRPKEPLARFEDAVGEQLKNFQRANPERAVIGMEIPNSFKEELRAVDERSKHIADGKPQDCGTAPVKNVDIVRSIAPKHRHFTVDDLCRILSEAGHHELSRNRQAVNSAIFYGTTRGYYTKVARATYELTKESEPEKVTPKPNGNGHDLNGHRPSYKHEEASPPPALQAAQPATPAPAPLSTAEQMASILAMTIAIGPEDEKLLNDAIEHQMKVLGLLARMARIAPMRRQFIEAMRVTNNDSCA